MEGRKRILITGASGFIGNSLIDEAINNEYEVYASVRKSTNTRTLESKNVNIVVTNFHDVNKLNSTLNSLPRFDYIIHNAGITMSRKKSEFFEVNYSNTRRLIETLDQINRLPQKFIYISSIASYGPGDEKSLSPISSHTFPWPLTQYGKSKLAAERFISNSPGLPYIILRPTAVYGPLDKNFIVAMRLINNGINFRIGLKSQKLTFIYVKDLSKLVFKVLESRIEKKSYFVSDGKIYSSRDFGKYVSNALDKKQIQFPVPIGIARFIAFLNESLSCITGETPLLSREKLRELSARNWSCDIKPLQSDFGFTPQYCLEKGIKETIEWYKDAGWLK